MRMNSRGHGPLPQLPPEKPWEAATRGHKENRDTYQQAMILFFREHLIDGQ